MRDEEIKKYLTTALRIDCELLMDSAISSNHVFSKKFDRKVKSYEKLANGIEKEIQISSRQSFKQLRRIILIAALIAAMSVTCFAVSKLVIKWFGTLDADKQIVYIKGETDNKDEGNIKFEAVDLKIPEDYELVQEDFAEEIEFYCCEYSNPEGEIITFIKHGNIDETGFVMNIEDASSETISINEKEIYLYTIGDTATLKWDDGRYYYELSGQCDITILKKIAGAI